MLGSLAKWIIYISPKGLESMSNPIDGSPPGSPGPGILQARTLEWVDISFSKYPDEPNIITSIIISESGRQHKPERWQCEMCPDVACLEGGEEPRNAGRL